MEEGIFLFEKGHTLIEEGIALFADRKDPPFGDAAPKVTSMDVSASSFRFFKREWMPA